MKFPHLGQAVLVYRETSLQLERGYSSTLLNGEYMGEYMRSIDARAASKGVTTWPALERKSRAAQPPIEKVHRLLIRNAFDGLCLIERRL